MNIQCKKIHNDAKVPEYAHAHDAGMDLFALEEVIVPRGEIRKIGTGIALEIPEGYVGLCFDKSGLSMNHGIKVLGGVIDAGYRGEIVVGVINLGSQDHVFKKHDKVTQLLIQPVIRGIIVETDELSDTDRGARGFGSTGK